MFKELFSPSKDLVDVVWEVMHFIGLYHINNKIMEREKVIVLCASMLRAWVMEHGARRVHLTPCAMLYAI